jgi:hypothetical protein
MTEYDAILDVSWKLLVVTGVVGMISTFIMQGIRKGLAWVDTTHPALKQLIVLLITWGLAFGSKFLGIALPADLAAIDMTTIQAVLASGFSMGFYTVLKAIGVIKPAPEEPPRV